MRRLRFTVTAKLLETMLALPDDIKLTGIQWDFAGCNAELYVDSPRFPQVQEGGIVPHVSPQLMLDEQGKMKTWDWNLASASYALPVHLHAMAMQLVKDLAEQAPVAGFFGRSECPVCRSTWNTDQPEVHKTECAAGRARSLLKNTVHFYFPEDAPSDQH